MKVGDMAMTLPVDPGGRVERLSAASSRRVIEPDADVVGEVADGAVIPREMLSVVDLGLELTDEQWVTLSREELASIFDSGTRFEAALMAGFGLMIGWHPDLRDPRVTYALHEVGEETRHSRLFIRLIEQLRPAAVNPFRRPLVNRLDRFVASLLLNWQALLCVMVLTGEEAPDLIQKRLAEHPDTDPFIKDVSRYHRAEEARHLAFARLLLPEVWERASRLERRFVRRYAPALMTGIVDTLVHPGVYRTVGLPGWRTWNVARKSASRRALRVESFRPVCAAMLAAGAFRRDRVPRAWRQACQVDAAGQPVG